VAVWSKQFVNGAPVETKGAVRAKLIPTVEDRGQWKPITKVDLQIHPHGKWLIWEPPVAGHKYVIGGDTAMGLDSSDNSVLCVIDVTSARQVAEFVDKMGPEKLAVEMAAGGYWYNQALLNPEINGLGNVLLNHLIKVMTYPNLYKWPKWDEVNRYTHKRGFETNYRTKMILVSSTRNLIEQRLIAIASRELLNEMSTFEQKMTDGIYAEFGAQRGRHDDRVMAFGLGVMAIEQSPVLLSELSRARGSMPTASDLHLAATADVRQPMPIPKQLQEKITLKHSIPWNSFQDEGIPA
jgi:hypothetical protein